MMVLASTVRTFQKPFNRHFLPLFGDNSLYFYKSILSNIESSKTKNQALDDSACSCHEIRIRSTLGFCENIEGFSQVLLKRLNEKFIRVCGVLKSAVKNGKNAIGHGWSATIGYLALVKEQIFCDLRVIFYGFEWKSQ